MHAQNYSYVLWWLRLATWIQVAGLSHHMSVTVLHKRLPLVSVLSQTAQFTPSQLVSFIYILYYHLCLDISSRLFFLQVFLPKISLCHCLPHIRHNHRPSPPRFDHPNYSWWDVSILYLVTVQYLQPTVGSSILGPNTLLSAIFPTIFSFHSLLNL